MSTKPSGPVSTLRRDITVGKYRSSRQGRQEITKGSILRISQKGRLTSLPEAGSQWELPEPTWAALVLTSGLRQGDKAMKIGLGELHGIFRSEGLPRDCLERERGGSPVMANQARSCNWRRVACKKLVYP